MGQRAEGAALSAAYGAEDRPGRAVRVGKDLVRRDSIQKGVEGKKRGEDPSNFRPGVIAIEGVEGVGGIEGDDNPVRVQVECGPDNVSSKFGASREATAKLVREEVVEEWLGDGFDSH